MDNKNKDNDIPPGDENPEEERSEERSFPQAESSSQRESPGDEPPAGDENHTLQEKDTSSHKEDLSGHEKDPSGYEKEPSGHEKDPSDYSGISSEDPEINSAGSKAKSEDENPFPADENKSGDDEDKSGDDEDKSGESDDTDINGASPQSEHPYPIRLKKSASNKIIFGVCGGIGEYLHIDPVVIRLFFVLSLLIGAWGAVIYFLATVFIPNSSGELPEDDYPGNPRERDNTRVLAGSFLLLAGAYILFRNLGLLYYFNFFGLARDVVIPVILIFAGIYIVVRYHSSGTLITESIPSRLYRIRRGRKLSGVCSGLAGYLNADVSIIRILWVVFTLSSFGAGIIIYLLFTRFVPEIDGDLLEQKL